MTEVHQEWYSLSLQHEEGRKVVKNYVNLLFNILPNKRGLWQWNKLYCKLCSKFNVCLKKKRREKRKNEKRKTKEERKKEQKKEGEKKEKIQLEEISLSVNWHGEWLSGDNYLKEGIVHDYC